MQPTTAVNGSMRRKERPTARPHVTTPARAAYQSDRGEERQETRGMQRIRRASDESADVSMRSREDTR